MEGLAAFLLAAGDAVDVHEGSTWTVEDYRSRASEYEAQPLILKGLVDHWAGIAELKDEAMVDLLESIVSLEDMRAYTTRLHGAPDAPHQPQAQAEASGPQEASSETKIASPWVPREEDLEVMASSRGGCCEDGSPGPSLRDVVRQRHTPVPLSSRQVETVIADAPTTPSTSGKPWHYLYSPLDPSSLTAAGFPSPPPCLCPHARAQGVQVRQANVWMGQSLTSRIHVDGLDNLLDHPNFARVERLVADLGPGDALFIPAGWWHEVFTCWQWSLSVNYWCELTHPRCRLRPSLLHISSGGRYTDFAAQKRRDEEGQGGEGTEADATAEELNATSHPKRQKTDGP